MAGQVSATVDPAGVGSVRAERRSLLLYVVRSSRMINFVLMKVVIPVTTCALAPRQDEPRARCRLLPSPLSSAAVACFQRGPEFPHTLITCAVKLEVDGKAHSRILSS